MTMRTRQDNDVVIIWEKNKGYDPGLQGGDYSGTSKRWVALNARGRRIFICDAFNKQFFISKRVNAVQWKTPEREYRLHHEPYRKSPLEPLLEVHATRDGLRRCAHHAPAKRAVQTDCRIAADGWRA
jgi:hypothetical protein